MNYLEKVGEEIKTHLDKRDFYEPWRCCRLLGAVKYGPKRRRYDLISTVNPDIQQWQNHLQQNGRDGGWKAQLVSVGEVDDFIDKIPDNALDA